MTKVEEIKAVIETLPAEEYAELRQWFADKGWREWDRQIEADSQQEKLDFLIKEAFEAKEKKKLRKL